ncbi:MAG: hypothetical protein M5U34_37945 [Chloroflexi bacterium]|nr:hypothetical protein [Chloroflexota bacterium]
MNLLLSRLDEQQRRWCVGVEAEKIGHGGTEYMSIVTGININTIRKGRREMAHDLCDRLFLTSEKCIEWPFKISQLG